LKPALDYFSAQESRYLLLLTKSTNLRPLSRRSPSPQVVVSFSVNSPVAAKRWEGGVPSPEARLRAAARAKKLGWRLRIRLDPIILESGLEHYEPICKKVAQLEPEVVTVGTLRQYPGLYRFSRQAPRKGLTRAPDGRMRYPVEERLKTYEAIRAWLGFQPALCKETSEVWDDLGWTFSGCNCTENPKGHHRGKRRGRAG
jgi:spore photoproduct lyase